MTLIPIAHLAEVGRVAAKEVPELRNTSVGGGFTFETNSTART
jgi:hypothetical protein